MATVHRTLEGSVEETSESIRRAAAAFGWALAEGDSNAPKLLTFKKGVRVLSWGSQMTVSLSAADGGTDVSVSTSETWALTDWGRGRRDADRLLNAV